MLHLLSPPFAPPRTVIFCRFLRAWGKQKILISLGNQDFTVFCFSSKWCHQESNRGHKDFQSFALPTELWHRCFSFALQRYIYFSNYQTLSGYFFQKIEKLSFFPVFMGQNGGNSHDLSLLSKYSSNCFSDKASPGR